MNIDLLIGIIGSIFIPLLLFFIPKFKNRKRKYLLEKFCENKQKLSYFLNVLEELMEKKQSWNQVAFNDSLITLSEIHTIGMNNFEKEYSYKQFVTLKNSKLSELRILEFIEKLKVQEHNLNLLIHQVEYLNSKNET